MLNNHDRQFDVLIVGAGPAGMAAAVAARSSGASVGVIDDNPAPGGQIWRGESETKPSSPESAEWFARVAAARPEILAGTTVIGPAGPGAIVVESGGRIATIRAGRTILAVGARELFLPFPGWTLPNVMGAGGLQAMAKAGLPVAGKRVVVAGSGPLLLAVAAYLRRKGAEVLLVAEQAPAPRLARFAVGLWRSPAKIRQALGLRIAMGSIPIRVGTWPVAAEGDGRVESVILGNGSSATRVACDYLACGFGLVPNVELPDAIGCAIDRGVVRVDDSGMTTVAGVYAAGEVAGVGGLDLALVTGQIAGYSAVGDVASARRLAPALDRARRFARALNHAFRLRDELRSLARPETIVCRCEDVAHGALDGRSSWVDAKLQTRCGMGPCQGRICGPAVGFVRGWPRASTRPPIFPTDLAHLGGPGI